MARFKLNDGVTLRDVGRFILRKRMKLRVPAGAAAAEPARQDITAEFAALVKLNGAKVVAMYDTAKVRHIVIPFYPKRGRKVTAPAHDAESLGIITICGCGD